MFKRLTLLWSLLLLIGSVATAQAQDSGTDTESGSDETTSPTYLSAADLYDGIQICISDLEGASTGYFYADKRYSRVSFSSAMEGWSSVFTLVKVQPTGDETEEDMANVYYLYSEVDGLYLKLQEAGKCRLVPTTSNVSEAARLLITDATDTNYPGAVQLKMIDYQDTRNLSAHYLYYLPTASNAPYIQNFYPSSPYTNFYLTKKPDSLVTATRFVADENICGIVPAAAATSAPQRVNGKVSVDASSYLKADSPNSCVPYTSTQSWLTDWTLLSVEIDLGVTDEDGSEEYVERPNVYYLYNATAARYLGKVPESGSGTKIQMVDAEADAGQFEILADADDEYAALLKSYNVTNSDGANYLSAGAQYLVNAAEGLDANKFYIGGGGDTSTYPVRCHPRIDKRVESYFVPYEYYTAGKEGYLNANVPYGKIEKSTTYKEWDSVLKLVWADEANEVTGNESENYLGTESEYNANFAHDYNLYSFINKKYIKSIESTDAGVKYFFADTQAEAGKFHFYADNINGACVMVKDVNNTSDNCWFSLNSDGALVNATVDSATPFFIKEPTQISYNAAGPNETVYISSFRFFDYAISPNPVNSVTKYNRNYSVLTAYKLVPADVSDVTDENKKTDVYYLYNEYTDTYMGKIGTIGVNNTVPLAYSREDAGRYKIEPATGIPEAVTFWDIDGDSGGANYLNLNLTSNGYSTYNVVCWYKTEMNRLFMIATAKDLGDPLITETLYDGLTVKIRPYMFWYNNSSSSREHGEGVVYANGTNNTVGASLTDPDDGTSLWTLKAATKTETITVTVDGVETTKEVTVTIPHYYYLYNEATGKYVGKNGGNSQTTFTLVDNMDDAGIFDIEDDLLDQTTVTLYDTTYNPEARNDNKAWWFMNNFSVIQNTNNKYGENNDDHNSNNYGGYMYNRFYIIPEKKPFSQEDSEKLLYELEDTVGDLVGDLIEEKITPLIEALKADPSSEEKYNALKDAIAEEDNFVHPKAKHLYYIESPFPYFSDLYLRETYYAKDWFEKTGNQRVYFHIKDWESDVVPAMWEFVDQPLLSGTDAKHYYMIRAVNSDDVLRMTHDDVTIDTRSKTDDEAGIFSLLRNELCVYPHSVALRAHWNNDTRSTSVGHSLLGIELEDNDSFTGDAVITDGLETPITPTEAPVAGANIWRIIEVTQFPIYFDGVTQKVLMPDGTEKQYYMNAYCFPFDVQVPEGLTAYSGGYGLLANEGDSEKYVDLVKFAVYDDSTGEAVWRNDIIPANSPCIIVSENQQPSEDEYYQLKVLYYDEEEGCESRYSKIDGLGLTGQNVPRALDEEEEVYIVNDDTYDTLTKVVEGTDYNTGADPDEPAAVAIDDAPDYALMTALDSSYVIMANNATIDIKDANAPEDPEYRIVDETTNDVLTGVNGIVDDNTANGYREPERDAQGRLIYYDLTGRRMVNPDPGIYILTNGQKVIVK